MTFTKVPTPKTKVVRLETETYRGMKNAYTGWANMDWFFKGTIKHLVDDEGKPVKN